MGEVDVLDASHLDRGDPAHSYLVLLVSVGGREGYQYNIQSASANKYSITALLPVDHGKDQVFAAVAIDQTATDHSAHPGPVLVLNTQHRQ